MVTQSSYVYMGYLSILFVNNWKYFILYKMVGVSVEGTIPSIQCFTFGGYTQDGHV